MKAVIWTDVIQASIMFLGLILSIIFGRYYSFQNHIFLYIQFMKNKRFDRCWWNIKSIGYIKKWKSITILSVCIRKQDSRD